jgi:hypothetical protein
MALGKPRYCGKNLIGNLGVFSIGVGFGPDGIQDDAFSAGEVVTVVICPSKR